MINQKKQNLLLKPLSKYDSPSSLNKNNTPPGSGNKLDNNNNNIHNKLPVSHFEISPQ